MKLNLIEKNAEITHFIIVRVSRSISLHVLEKAAPVYRFVGKNVSAAHGNISVQRANEIVVHLIHLIKIFDLTRYVCTGMKPVQGARLCA